MKRNGTNAAMVPTDRIEPCISAAESLLEVLREESEVLRRFVSKDLLELLPRKEYLVQDLGKKMSAYKASARMAAPAEQVGVLRTRLREIDRVNRSNRVFIEGSLEYWRELLRAIFPSNYSARDRKPAQGYGIPLKGMSFRMEV